MRVIGGTLAAIAIAAVSALPLFGQSLGNTGTVEGTVMDASGAVVPGARVRIRNPISGYDRTAAAGSNGSFRFGNVPPNNYHLTGTASGFAVAERDVMVRSSVPVSVRLELAVAGASTTVNVDDHSADMLENVPYAHNDLDRAHYERLPTSTPGSQLSDAITFSTPGVVADSNGFFHPLGDHAQTSFVIDNQPVSDQQSKQFSTQMPLNAVESMELITGAPSAEYGDKSSLVVNMVTRSGLGARKPTGSLRGQYGSFGTYGEEFDLSLGGARIGNFLVANAQRSGRFLDTPEFSPLHARGNNQTLFDRADFQPDGRNIFHLNLFASRNWFQTPNTYDQQAAGQDQRQLVRSFNVAPGYQHTFNPSLLLSVSPFFRQDHVNYYPSRDEFADTPVTIAAKRRLREAGFRSDIAYVRGRHTVKAGGQYSHHGLSEDFALGVTDPAFNPVCVSETGEGDRAISDPARCVAAGLAVNPDLQAGLVPYDLTRGGTRFTFRGRAGIGQGALFMQDQMSLGRLSVNAGLRADFYRGLSSSNMILPRLGLSYQLPSKTVLRAAYSRTMETPYNEYLILSSSTGSGGLAEGVFGAYGAEPIRAGKRNQFNAGLQQGIGRWLMVDADYFWKYTSHAYDFGNLLNTTITFPIDWRRSKIDGFSTRVSTAGIKGFQACLNLGHTRARFFGPETGGLIFESPVDATVFRIDHDQAYQQTLHLRYDLPKNRAWLAFTWRYDSGLVAGEVPDLEAALGLSADQQAAIGFYCGGQRAALGAPVTACTTSDYGATRLRIPAAGTAHDDHNPPRIAPRHLLDLSVGTDDLFRGEGAKITLRGTVANLTNRTALYNFLSTFSGTHFVSPRSYTAAIGIRF